MINLPLVSLDLELLGDGESAEIIEVGAVKFRGTETLGTFSALVRPGGQLTYRIEELTGLSQPDLEQAEPLDDVLARLSVFIGGAPLVGQSIGLDVEHLGRAGLPLRNPQLDTFELAMLLRPGLVAYDLGSIARALGVAIEVPHRALPDALLARDVFLALVELVGKIELDTLSQIVRLAGSLDWPLKLVFSEAQREKVRAMVASGALAERVGAQDTLVPLMQPPPASPSLAPRERPEPLDVARLAASLDEDGAIARAVPRFEERAEQREMLTAVAEAFNDNEVLLVEAGTGTGKSVAYLLPALHYATANDRQVVVSTNTINLQDQLCQKDLPALIEATGIPARVSVLKGRANYLCLRRWVTLLRSDELRPAERMLLVKTLLWLPRTTRGDKAELKLSQPEEEAWSRVAATVEACSPGRCSFHHEGTCWVARARRLAESAHLIVVNHSLLLADLMTGNQVLPEHRHLIVDEAHHLEDEATAQLSRRVTERELTRHLSILAEPVGASAIGLLADAAMAVRSHAPAHPAEAAIAGPVARGERQVPSVRAGFQRLFRMLKEIVQSIARRGEGGAVTIRVTSTVRAQPVWSDVDVLWGEIGREVLDLERTITELVMKLEELRGRSDALAACLADLATEGQFWAEVRGHLNDVIALSRSDTVSWLSLGLGDDTGLHAAPLEVAEILRDQLIGTKDTAILTSATLTVEGSFRYIQQRLGLSDARELAVGSPFDYATSTLVYVPSDCPEPYQPGYQKAVERIILDVATKLNGRTLVLFTSHSQLRTTYAALRDELDARRLLLLGQRMNGSSRSRLLETFRSGPPAVLLGTSSFWEGIDVVGDALSCLIMARLPFAPPTDPVFEARAELYDDPFTQYTLPQAALRFRQGFGRLIRSRTDRGVMLVLDGRLRTRGYRRTFLRSLPDCQVRSGPGAEAGQVARAWVGDAVP
jgi:predicted DnaQ family exonuclease/DinG family helicase